MSAWELPTTVMVAGRSFAIRSDFRAVLDALAALTDPDLTQQEQYVACLQILYPRWKELPDANAALRAAFTFINEGKEDEQQVFFDCRAQEQVRGLTDIQRAARSLYLIRASFGTDRRTFATAPKGVRNISASFPAVQERLRRVIIENLDFEHLIKTYDRENALFYCDPPYVETEKYYRARFQESDHKRLADALHNIKGRFLLSYNDCPQVRELYADCIIEPVSRRNTLSAQSVDGYKEVLVRNYEL